MQLFPRHGETHFANINYGLYALAASVVYVLVIIVVRRVVPSRQKTNSKWKNYIIRNLYYTSPLLHLTVLTIALAIPFVHHYSVKENVSLYVKRLGRLSYVLVSLNLFITIRPNFLMPGYQYLDLIPLHKWLSRGIVVLALVHGVAFIIIWVLRPNVSLIDKAIKNVWNLIGVLLSILLVALVAISLKPMRRFSYNTFYAIHTIASWAMVYLTALHARPGVFIPYTIINSCILLLQILSKCFFTRPVDLVSKHKTHEGLCRIVLPRNAMPEHFSPGSHLRISPYRKLNPLYWLLPSHPYTVASLPGDQYVELVVREHSGGFEFEHGRRYTIQNFYRSVSGDSLQKAKRVALVCGGSGISYALPIYRYFSSLNGNSQLNYIKLIWLVRDLDDLAAVEDMDLADMETSTFEIFLTKAVPTDDAVEGGSEIVMQNNDNFDDLDFELESFGDQVDQNGGLLEGAKKADKLASKLASNIHLGRRLDWFTDLAQFVEPEELDNTWLFLCGPMGLINAGKQFGRDNKINVSTEVYAL